MKSSKKNTSHHAERTFLRSAYSGFCWIPPVARRLFEVNSEPHTGARPSVRLCVGLMTLLGHRNTATTKKLDFKNSHITSVGAK